MTLHFEIPCVPPRATSQQKGACRTPVGIRFFKKKNVAKAEHDLLVLLTPHRPAAPLEGALRLTVLFRFPWRVAESKLSRAFGIRPMDVAPDASNLIKLIEDCMTRIGFWHDDGQIADQRMIKQWGDWTGIIVTVERILDAEAAK